MGRHPFAARYLGLGEMPIEKAIAECRFAYSRDGTRTKMSPPPYTLPLGAATPAIAEYFERAFHPDGRRGGRPTPEDWVRTLEALKASLSDCPTVPWHQYPPGVRTCPWCEIERASGAKLYGGALRAASAPIADLEALWARYLKIADPAPRPLPREEDWNSTGRSREIRAPMAARSCSCNGHRKLRRRRRGRDRQHGCSLGAACRRRLLTRRVRPTPIKRAELEAALARAEAAWHSVVEDWRTKTAAVDFASERRIILGLKAQLDALSVERAARLQTLAKPVAEAEQRLTYLAQFRIEDAALFNIGAARIAVLRSWGVETAAEIGEEKVGSIPGFGRNLTERLVNWREGFEQRFHFEPGAITDPRDVQLIDRELAARRTRYKELRPAILALEKRINDTGDEMHAVWQRLEAAFGYLMLAKYNVASAARR